jgi:serine/threonine-protein kinase
MTAFPPPPKDDYAAVYLEDTDKALAQKVNQSTRYAYFKTIARGGKSIIRSCKDMHLGRVIVHKTMKPEFSDDPVEQRRFLREARIQANLQHPSIVPTYELGRDTQGRYYFTMKLVHGYTLREVLDYRERYDLTQLMEVVVQVAHALEYAHSHRVVHRDIKPENVLVGRFGEVLLLDWGLAKVWRADGTSDEAPRSGRKIVSDAKVSSMTGQAGLEGTICYMSPEQIRREEDIDYRTDIYSLGAIIYEILAEQTPATGETVREVSEQVLNVVPPKPSQVAKTQVPQLLDELAVRCISKQRDERPQSCGEVVRLIQEGL